MLPRQTLYGSLKPLRYEDLYPSRNDTNDTTMEIDLMLNFAPRFLPTRLWEIRIAQIPFSQRAPAGCLQYFTGTEGLFQVNTKLLNFLTYLFKYYTYICIYHTY